MHKRRFIVGLIIGGVLTVATIVNLGAFSGASRFLVVSNLVRNSAYFACAGGLALGTAIGLIALRFRYESLAVVLVMLGWIAGLSLGITIVRSEVATFVVTDNPELLQESAARENRHDSVFRIVYGANEDRPLVLIRRGEESATIDHFRKLGINLVEKAN